MMQFSRKLMNAKCEVEVADPTGAMVVAKGQIISTYEGRGWIAMTMVLMFDGPQAGRCLPFQLVDISFPQVVGKTFEEDDG